MKKNWLLTIAAVTSLFIISPFAFAQTQDLEKKTLPLTFTTIYDYNDCLDDVLLLYEKRLEQKSKLSQCIGDVIQVYGNSLTQAQALEIIQVANFRATNAFHRQFYPARGIRMRAAQLLGYIYEIDVNDQEILDLAASNPINNTPFAPSGNLWREVMDDPNVKLLETEEDIQDLFNLTRGRISSSKEREIREILSELQQANVPVFYDSNYPHYARTSRRGSLVWLTLGKASTESSNALLKTLRHEGIHVAQYCQNSALQALGLELPNSFLRKKYRGYQEQEITLEAEAAYGEKTPELTANLLRSCNSSSSQNLRKGF